MPKPRPLPEPLTSKALRTSEALAMGASRHQLSGSRIERPIHGVIALAANLDELAARCRAIAVGLPAVHAFSHVTAAQLLGLPLPTFIDTSMIHVSVPSDFLVPDHQTLVTHGQWLPPEHITTVGGVRCVRAARCFLDLAAHMPYEFLTALGDHALHHQLMNLNEVGSIVAVATRRRGVVCARKALPLLDGRAESPPESLTRVWLGGAGLPAITPQFVVTDELGNFVARVDLCIEEYKIVIEYQGAYHRDAVTFAADIERRRRLRALGYLVVEIEAHQLRSRRRLLAVVVEALRERGWTGSPLI